MEIARHYAEINKVSLAEAGQSKVVTDAMDERRIKIEAIEYERSRVIKDRTDANIAAYEREAAAAKKAAQDEAIARNAAESEGATRPRRAGRIDPGLSPFTVALTEINKKFGEGSDTAARFATALQGIESVAGGVANAVGQAVNAFVLFGTVEGGFRKFAAEMIAQIASMAAVQAVYELAQGLAWLALNFFFPNPAYAKAAATAFTSAAVFGSIAGVAAVAGRVVAGDSFKQGAPGGASGASGGSSGGSGSSSSSGSSGSSSPIVMGSQRGPDVLHLQVNHTFTNTGAVHSYVESAVVKSAQGNGAVRQVIVKELNRQS